MSETPRRIPGRGARHKVPLPGRVACAAEAASPQDARATPNAAPRPGGAAVTAEQRTQVWPKPRFHQPRGARAWEEAVCERHQAELGGRTHSQARPVGCHEEPPEC